MIIEGVVARGRSLGHKLGFPTANIELDDEVNMENGVYRSRVFIDTHEYRGVSNLGTNPTVNGDRRKLETHILDFDADIYGKHMSVELLEKIRSEMRFESVEQLQEQIDKDIKLVKKL